MNFSHRLVFAGKSNGTFVQCSRIKCAKWRFLPEFEDPALVSAATKSFLHNNTMHTTDTNTKDDTSNQSNQSKRFSDCKIQLFLKLCNLPLHLQVPADWECSMNWDVRLNSCEKGKSEEWVEASNEMVSQKKCNEMVSWIECNEMLSPRKCIEMVSLRKCINA